MIALVDIAGYIALVLNLVALSAKSRKELLLIQIVASMMFVWHYWLLGAIAGALQVLVTIIRNALFLNTKRFKQPFFILIFCLLLATFLAVVGWQGPATMLALFSVYLGTIGRWQQNLETLLLIAFVANVLALAYAFAVSSLPAIISTIIQLIVIAVSVAREEWKSHLIQKHLRDWHLSSN